MARPRGESTGRVRLAEAAGRRFRTGGYGGVGVDAIAKEVGLTSGAFYAHYGSKAQAFRVAVADGFALLIEGVRRFQADHKDCWLPEFVDFYLDGRLSLALEEACALPTFSGDVARADDETRDVYSQALARLAEEVGKGLRGSRRSDRAYAILATLSGAATMARAVRSEAVRAEIVSAARRSAKAMAMA